MIRKFIKNNYDDILDLMNRLKVGVYITDGKGTTLLVNDESCKTGGLTRQQVIGRHVSELEEEGFIEESVTMRALKSGQEEIMIQNLGDGGRVFCSSHPIYDNGKISYVITTEKDITESQILQDLLKEKQIETEKYEMELTYLRKMNLLEKGPVVAVDENMSRNVSQAKRVAALDATVLITGESGTGKEVIANLIYSNSKRADKPFIKVNCSAIPENLMESEMFGYQEGAFTGAKTGGKAGYFQMANGGTLFLDEIGEMPLNLQSKLLRVLQDKEVMPLGGEVPIPVDIRLIAATNKDLNAAMGKGNFRKDLYYRLAVMIIEIPPLRERKADIAHLASNFVDQFNKKYGFKKTLEPQAIDLLMEYDWPGNVRELQNLIERCMISYDNMAITPYHVASFIRPSSAHVHYLLEKAESDISETKTLSEMMAEFEKKILVTTLKGSKNASEASRKLGIDRSTMSRNIKKHNIYEF
jgi:PAS domain S-box-containing protein